jgi:hypothetical protein
MHVQELNSLAEVCSVRINTIIYPGPDARVFRISPLLVTYEVRKFPATFIVAVFENTNGLSFVYKTKLTLKIKRKHLKDILR